MGGILFILIWGEIFWIEPYNNISVYDINAHLYLFNELDGQWFIFLEKSN